MNNSINPITAYQYFLASPYFAGFNYTQDQGSDWKIFITYYVNLPQSLKDFISSEETATSIMLTGMKYELGDKQVSQVAQTIRDLIIGKIFIKDLPNNLSTQLGVDASKAREIVNKIVSDTFSPIIEDIKKIQRSKFPDKITEMQKESRPQGLNQKPPEIKQEQKPSSPPPIPPQPQPKPPLAPPLQTLQKPVASPPLQKPTSPPPVSPPLPIQPPPQSTSKPQLAPLSPSIPRPQEGPLAQKPPNLNEKKDEIKTPPIIPQAQPKIDSVQKPQFKIPDIGQPFSSPEERPAQDGIKSPQIGQVGKSLEEELEKVASVIDLRNKSEN